MAHVFSEKLGESFEKASEMAGRRLGGSSGQLVKAAHPFGICSTKRILVTITITKTDNGNDTILITKRN